MVVSCLYKLTGLTELERVGEMAEGVPGSGTLRSDVSQHTHLSNYDKPLFHEKIYVLGTVEQMEGNWSLKYNAYGLK